MRRESNNMADYLEETEDIDYSHESIKRLAEQLDGDCALPERRDDGRIESAHGLQAYVSARVACRFVDGFK